jgi:uncharacterized protein YodC (DUF2158 family)
MTAFNKGDVVQLKSGGPIMTVAELGDFTYGGGPEHGVKCIWFDRGRQEHALFDSAVLKHYKEEGGSFEAVAVFRDR